MSGTGTSISERIRTVPQLLATPPYTARRRLDPGATAALALIGFAKDGASIVARPGDRDPLSAVVLAAEAYGGVLDQDHVVRGGAPAPWDRSGGETLAFALYCPEHVGSEGEPLTGEAEAARKILRHLMDESGHLGTAPCLPIGCATGIWFARREAIDAERRVARLRDAREHQQVPC